ncbi:hypothetical protein HMPREF9120_01837 [Neisseria sp. oral taxon 020 str. F0370]|nr:hypothetical protein HMPREF9120_01837 [Neisseria sp. oral taxon 020 str. F0370]
MLQTSAISCLMCRAARPIRSGGRLRGTSEQVLTQQAAVKPESVR